MNEHHQAFTWLCWIVLRVIDGILRTKDLRTPSYRRLIRIWSKEIVVQNLPSSPTIWVENSAFKCGLKSSILAFVEWQPAYLTFKFLFVQKSRHPGFRGAALIYETVLLKKGNREMIHSRNIILLRRNERSALPRLARVTRLIKNLYALTLRLETLASDYSILARMFYCVGVKTLAIETRRNSYLTKKWYWMVAEEMTKLFKTRESDLVILMQRNLDQLSDQW